MFGKVFDLRWLFAATRRWVWLIAGCALLGVISALVSTTWLPPLYTASATLLIQPAGDSGMSDYQDILTGEAMARTYVQMLQEESVLEAAAEKIQWREPPEALARRVKAEAVVDTQLIRLSVQADNASRAALLANAIAETFIERLEESQAERDTGSLAALDSQMAELSTQIEAAQKQVDAMATPTTSEQQAELAHLESVLAGYRNTYATLLQNYEQMRLAAARSTQSLTIAEPARAPQNQDRRRPLYMAVAGLVGAIVGLGGAFLLERTDDTIKTPHDVKRMLGFKPLGTIARMRRAERGLIVAAQPQSAHAEAFRILCTNVGFYAEGSLPKTILVTSPSGSEGKSLISANLAMTLAQARLRVVAVDADLRRPRLGRLFDFDPRSAGLSSALLTGRVDGFLRPTKVKQLAVLTGGALPANPGQLFRSPHMQTVLDDLARRADVILVDGPPILPVADTALIAHRVDGVLLVVRSGRTRPEAVQSAMEALRQAGAQVIGVVLTDLDPHRSLYYSTYHRYLADSRVEQQSQPEQAQDGTPEGQAVGQLTEGELAAQVQEAPAWRQAVAEIHPHEASVADVQDAVALAQDTADRLPGGVAASPGEKVWEAEYESFLQRELLEAQVEYLFLDALHKPLPTLRSDEEDVLCAWAINADGRRVLLHVASCSVESYEVWLDFLRDMVRRGLSAPILTIVHGTSDVMRAVGEVFPNSLQQRCLSRKIRDVSDETPRSARAEVMAMVQAAYLAPNPRVAEKVSADALKLYSTRFPTAMKSFRNDWETCIAYLRCPPAHHSSIRSTTLLQRSFAKERRQILDGLHTQGEKGSPELVFALLWQASQRWQRITMGEAEREQLRLLRSELGLLDG